MKRFFTLIVTGILFIMLSSFLRIFQNGVTVTADMPDVIDAGMEITVNVTIKKGRLTGFARFLQELPVGFTAEPVNSGYGTFEFQDQKVSFLWFNMPDNDEINISYKITANERLIGKIELQGRFQYIENNVERKTVELQPQMLAIAPSPKVPVDRQVDVNDYAKVASIEAEAASGQTIALRQQPVWMEEDRFFLVTLLINKDAAQKYAKIEENVPAGFIAAGLDSKGGIFSFDNNIARFMWMDMPPEPYFTVTYKLIPQGDQAAMKIDGMFTFLVNGITFTTKIIERGETLAGLTRTQLNSILRTLDIKIEEQHEVIADKPPTPPVQDATVRLEPVKPPAGTGGADVASGNANYLLTPEPGIRYRVQLAAGHKEVNTIRYFRNYRLERTVLREEHDGWFKYSVGSFAEYRDARDYRVFISNSTKIQDAFVTAYNEGKRITVQEALMASNQKWIR